MSKSTILVQLDGDPQPSVFDGVVAVDTGIDYLFRHGGVEPDQVRDLVHGAMFTRGPQELKHTAIFVGDVPSVDVAGARSAGIAPVLIDRHDQFTDWEVPRLASIAELPAWLGSAGDQNA